VTEKKNEAQEEKRVVLRYAFLAQQNGKASMAKLEPGTYPSAIKKIEYRPNDSCYHVTLAVATKPMEAMREEKAAEEAEKKIVTPAEAGVPLLVGPGGRPL
jgi:hypothetical protein